MVKQSRRGRAGRPSEQQPPPQGCKAAPAAGRLGLTCEEAVGVVRCHLPPARDKVVLRVVCSDFSQSFLPAQPGRPRRRGRLLRLLLPRQAHKIPKLFRGIPDCLECWPCVGGRGTKRSGCEAGEQCGGRQCCHQGHCDLHTSAGICGRRLGPVLLGPAEDADAAPAPADQRPASSEAIARFGAGGAPHSCLSRHKSMNCQKGRVTECCGRGDPAGRQRALAPEIPKSSRAAAQSSCGRKRPTNGSLHYMNEISQQG